MNYKLKKYVFTFLSLIILLLTITTKVFADSPSNLTNSSKVLANSEKIENNKVNKHKGIDIFSNKNLKYLSDDQKRQLQELKKYKEKDEKLSKQQVDSLHSILESIIKGRLGPENYEHYVSLNEKVLSKENLTNEESDKLKEYREIIDGSKLSTKDILNQFLR